MRDGRIGRVARLASAVTAMVLWLVPGAALAHDVPPSIVMLDIGRVTLDVELQLPLSELGSALSLPLAANPAAAIGEYSGQIAQYVREQVHVRSRDRRPFVLQSLSTTLRRTSNANWTSNDWVVATERFAVPAGASTEDFVLEDALVVRRVVSHKTLVYVRHDVRNGLLGETPLAVGLIDFGRTELHIDGSDGGWLKGFLHLFTLGMHHIAQGPDHLLFLLALLIPAPLLAIRGRWTGGKDGALAVRSIVTVVSGFTLGHCVTLVLATLGWVQAPVRAVEVLIAVSILVSSLHALRPLFPGREVWVALGFGLVHGLAFAETLSGLGFDRTSLAISLLGFNLGIEAMQLLVILVTLPLLLTLSLGRAYHAFRLTAASFAIACAIAWVAERAFDVTNPLAAVVAWMTGPPLWCIVIVSVCSMACMIFKIRLTGSSSHFFDRSQNTSNPLE